MIIGLTDRAHLRRDGKIRAGGPKQGNKTGENLDHFDLRDAPQLREVLGDNPKAIEFTFVSDNPRDNSPIDLRMYSHTELVCQSQHNADPRNGGDPTKPVGAWAAYRGVHDLPGVTQEKYPNFDRARKRHCAYKECQEYQKDMCYEHMFVNIMIPHYSMAAIFTLETSSILAVLNLLGVIDKVSVLKAGKLSGEIFRMFKDNAPVSYQKKDGSQGKSEKPVVHFEHVEYSKYMEKWGGKLSKENASSLEMLRARPFMQVSSAYLMGSAAAQQLSGPVAAPQLEAPAAVVEDPQAPVRAKANHEVVAPLFAELSALVGIDNNELNRMKTAEKFATVEQLHTYLKGKVADVKKKKAAEAVQGGPNGQQQQPSAAATTQASQAAAPAATTTPQANVETPLW